MQVIDGKSIEQILDEWQPAIHKMAVKTYIPDMVSDDIEQELLLTFVAAWAGYKPELGHPFTHYLRVCLKYKITSLMRYAYVSGRKDTQTFTDLFGDDEEKLDRILQTVQDAMGTYDVKDWRQIMLDEAAALSTAHTCAIELFIAKAIAEDVTVATQAPSVLFTSLVAEVLEEVRRKYHLNSESGG